MWLRHAEIVHIDSAWCHHCTVSVNHLSDGISTTDRREDGCNFIVSHDYRSFLSFSLEFQQEAADFF